MIVSMTGYGTASRKIKGLDISVEMRSVNSKYLEVSSRLPFAFSDKENEIKELIRQKISRGKINLSLNIDKNAPGKMNLNLQPSVVKDYHRLLQNLKRVMKTKEEIKIDHLLKFTEIFKVDENAGLEKNWKSIEGVIKSALNDLSLMKAKEGKVLEKDIIHRIGLIEKSLDKVSQLSADNLEDSRMRLREKVSSIITDATKIEFGRIELELVMLADKLDVTEEIVRARSHLSYFRNNMKSSELSGRRLNFLVQEINREINTIASKSNNSEVSQMVVEMKEELEKIKEQLQNAE